MTNVTDDPTADAPLLIPAGPADRNDGHDYTDRDQSTLSEADLWTDVNRHGRHHWPSVNITPIERVGRAVLGIGAVIAGAVLLASALSALAVVLEALLIVAGLDLAVTGTLGHCPLYQRTGHVPASLRRSS